MNVNLSQNISSPDQNEDTGWKVVYKIGAAAALLTFLVGLLDIALMFLPGELNAPGELGVQGWFELLNSNTFLGLRNLGIFNVITTAAMLAVFYALYAAQRHNGKAPAGLALFFLFLGACVYISNNNALSLYTLAHQYAATSDETIRSGLLAAGQTLLAQEDVGAGAFLGFFFSELGGIGMALVMLRTRRLGIWVPRILLVGESLLLAFNIWAAFFPLGYELAMIPAVLGGLLSMLACMLIARALLQLSKPV